MLKRRTLPYALGVFGTLIIGIAGGLGYSSHVYKQSILRQLDDSLSVFANTLSKARWYDLRYSTMNPTTSLEKGYQVNLKVDVGQLSELWEVMSPQLVAQGLPTWDVGQIGEGLQIIYMNILPPYGTMDEPRSVKRAREWIISFCDAISPNSTPTSSNTIYLSRLESKISVIASEYRSYKSDPNFQVLP